jgi:predicted metal-binding membrane protein
MRSKMGRGVKSLSRPWAALWAFWSVAILVFVCARILPALVGFMSLASERPETMLHVRSLLAVGYLLAWFVLGLLALVYIQAFLRRSS